MRYIFRISFSIEVPTKQLSLYSPSAMSKSHHFRGIGQYAEQLMDLAEGRPAFAGRGQKPSNKKVLAAIASIKKCRQGSFFNPGEKKPCSCGWHTKAAARKQARPATSIHTSHSVLDRTFYTQRGIGSEVFDARLGWWILGYNRRRLRALSKRVPPDSMPPKVYLLLMFLTVIHANCFVSCHIELYYCTSFCFVVFRCASTTSLMDCALTFPIGR